MGHCEVRGVPRPYDPRPAHPLTPARKTLIATEALRRAASKGKGGHGYHRAYRARRNVQG